MTDPRGWAVQPANWATFDPDGVVYCVDYNTAQRIAQQLQSREGDQMIWKMTNGQPIRWTRVSNDKLAHNQLARVSVVL
tara:strand:- start:819 stop:1055 length:237 start_codon:yes stop_codon:yes gene_type:complete